MLFRTILCDFAQFRAISHNFLLFRAISHDVVLFRTISRNVCVDDSLTFDLDGSIVELTDDAAPNDSLKLIYCIRMARVVFLHFPSGWS